MVCSLATGCSSSVLLSFQQNSSNSNFNFLVSGSGAAEAAQPFAADLCVVDGDVNTDKIPDLAETTSAALFDLDRKETLYAKSAYARVYPASLTKVMTALVALEHSSPDTILTAPQDVWVTEQGAQVAGVNPGDTMTLDQALHLLLIYSANDVAIMIAENVAGSKEEFINMMNEEAKKLGATGTNFINSNGLTDENHYTTLYDMYLIFNRAVTYDEFTQIINMASYSTAYHDSDGNAKEITVNSTNYYQQGLKKAPTGVTIIGGKTGTTTAAGHNLVLYCKDTSGHPYIAIVMKAIDEDALYDQMGEVLALIPQG